MIKINSINNASSNIVFCIIDSISEYKNPWIQEIVKNSIDSEISMLSGQGFDVVIGDDENVLLSSCVGNYDYAVVCLSGIIWADQKDFFNLIKLEIEKEFFLMGHILDKKEAYYELHPQCYVINLNIYNSLNKPIIGNRELSVQHEKVEPLRSLENFHDDYTPMWIRKGNNIKRYYHKCHGWNIIDIALSNDLNVKVFNADLRNSKRYFYPDDHKDLSHLSKFYLENTIASRSWVNPFSTTKIWFPPISDPMDNLVTVCNGLDWVRYLKNYNFHNQTKVKFLDYNIMSLEFINRLIYEWDGIDYIEFLESFGNEKVNHLNMNWDSLYGLKDHLNERWTSFKLEVDWDIIWKKIKSQIDFKIEFKDFLHNEINDHWLDSSYNTQNTLINLSHVYNYHSTSIFYTLEYRLGLENYTIEYLKRTVPDAYLIIDGRSWHGFKQYENHEKSSQVVNFNTVSLKDLTAPPWRIKDWHEKN